MSYSFGASADCGPGEYFDEIVQECLCKPGFTPSSTVGSCVQVKQGGTTGADCLMKGMDFDIASQQCITKCPPGYGRDINGNCVFVSTTHGVIPQPPGPPPPAPPPPTDQAFKASMPWVIGGAIGLVGLLLLGGAAGAKRREPATANRRRRSRRNWL